MQYLPHVSLATMKLNFKYFVLNNIPKSLWKVLTAWTLSNVQSGLYPLRSFTLSVVALALFPPGDENNPSAFGNVTTSPQFTGKFWGLLRCSLFRERGRALLYELISLCRYRLTCRLHGWSQAALKIVCLALSGLLTLSTTFLPLSHVDSRKLRFNRRETWECASLPSSQVTLMPLT